MVCSVCDCHIFGHYTEFSETPNQAYFYVNFWLVLYVYIFLLGILIYASFFSADASQTSKKTHGDGSRGPNLDSATKDQKITTNPMPQGLSCPIAVGVI